MAGKSRNFPKEHLKDSDLLPKTYRYSDMRCIALTMFVKNYNKLKQNVIYYASASICGFTFVNKLVIADETLFVFVSTDLIVKNPCATMLKSKGHDVTNNFMQKGKLLISEFCNKAIMDPENEYLLEGNLLIEFKYEMERLENYPCSINYSSLQNLIDRDEYCFDLKELYPCRKRFDLLLLLGGSQYSCHKEILVENSKVFAESLQKLHTSPNKKARIILKEHPYFFEPVLTYMYSKTLDYRYEECMMEIYRIANILRIEPLMKKCMDYFETILSPSNELIILQAATMCNLPDLKNAVAHYMEKRGSKALSSYRVLRTLQQIRGICNNGLQ